MSNKLMIRVIFFIVFILLNIYFLLIKTELYESKTALIVRSLNSTVDITSGLSIFNESSMTQLQDSKIIEEYILSMDLFTLLDKKFQLRAHYKSDKLDIIQRLAPDANNEEILKFYRYRLLINYDEFSGILHVSYLDSDSTKAKEVLEFLVKEVEFEINEFNRRRAEKQLDFINLEHNKSKQEMENSSAKLEAYQNKHLLLDPTNKATSTTSIIFELESTLTQKKIELSTKKSYLNSRNYEIQSLKREILEIEKSIRNTERGLVGKGKKKLNKSLFEYEKLKMQFDFDVQVYTNSLLQLKSIRLETLKKAKTLSILSKPNLPDGYTYPNKPKTFATLIIVMLLIYGISSML